MKEQSRGASNTNNKLSNQATLEIMQQQIKADTRRCLATLDKGLSYVS